MQGPQRESVLQVSRVAVKYCTKRSLTATHSSSPGRRSQYLFFLEFHPHLHGAKVAPSSLGQSSFVSHCFPFLAETAPSEQLPVGSENYERHNKWESSLITEYESICILTLIGDLESTFMYSVQTPAIERGLLKKQVAYLPHSFLWKHWSLIFLKFVHFPILQYW